MIFKWRELYRTYSQKEQIYFCKKLRQQDIPFKIKIHSLRSRMANNVLMRGNPMVENSANMKTDAMNEYVIYTTADFLEQAKQMLYS